MSGTFLSKMFFVSTLTAVWAVVALPQEAFASGYSCSAGSSQFTRDNYIAASRNGHMACRCGGGGSGQPQFGPGYKNNDPCFTEAWWDGCNKARSDLDAAIAKCDPPRKGTCTAAQDAEIFSRLSEDCQNLLRQRKNDGQKGKRKFQPDNGSTGNVCTPNPTQLFKDANDSNREILQKIAGKYQCIGGSSKLEEVFVRKDNRGKYPFDVGLPSHKTDPAASYTFPLFGTELPGGSTIDGTYKSNQAIACNNTFTIYFDATIKLDLGNGISHVSYLSDLGSGAGSTDGREWRASLLGLKTYQWGMPFYSPAFKNKDAVIGRHTRLSGGGDYYYYNGDRWIRENGKSVFAMAGRTWLTWLQDNNSASAPNQRDAENDWIDEHHGKSYSISVESYEDWLKRYSWYRNPNECKSDAEWESVGWDKYFNSAYIPYPQTGYGSFDAYCVFREFKKDWILNRLPDSFFIALTKSEGTNSHDASVTLGEVLEGYMVLDGAVLGTNKRHWLSSRIIEQKYKKVADWEAVTLDHLDQCPEPEPKPEPEKAKDPAIILDPFDPVKPCESVGVLWQNFAPGARVVFKFHNQETDKVKDFELRGPLLDTHEASIDVTLPKEITAGVYDFFMIQAEAGKSARAVLRVVSDDGATSSCGGSKDTPKNTPGDNKKSEDEPGNTFGDEPTRKYGLVPIEPSPEMPVDPEPYDKNDDGKKLGYVFAPAFDYVQIDETGKLIPVFDHIVGYVPIDKTGNLIEVSQTILGELKEVSKNIGGFVRTHGYGLLPIDVSGNLLNVSDLIGGFVPINEKGKLVAVSDHIVGYVSIDETGKLTEVSKNVLGKLVEVSKNIGGYVEAPSFGESPTTNSTPRCDLSKAMDQQRGCLCEATSILAALQQGCKCNQDLEFLERYSLQKQRELYNCVQ